MLKIGLIDFYFNNWHTDHYPEYMKLAAQRYHREIAVTDAWAMREAPAGAMSNQKWCAHMGIRLAASEQELIDRVDAIMVMGADDCREHELLAQGALKSGKPVYCDKTFAPDLASAQRMFRLAEAHGTPVFTCSAQRYVMELQAWRCLHNGQNARYCATQGPGDLANYSIHQFEMVEYLMGTGAKECMAFEAGGVQRWVYRYEDGRTAEVTQGPGLPFRMSAADGENGRDIAVTDYYMALMHALCEFFAGAPAPVAREDTLEIMAMQQTAREALEKPWQWVPVADWKTREMQGESK